jgi:hypothetical protein
LHANTTNTTSVVQTTQTIRANYSATLVNSFGTGWNATTGILTVPRAGYYSIEAQAEMIKAWTSGNFFNIWLYVSGAIQPTLLDQFNAGFSGTYHVKVRVSRVVYLNAGQTLDLRFQVTGTGTTTGSRAFNNYFIVSEIK